MILPNKKALEREGVSVFNAQLKAKGQELRAVFYAKFSARLNVPRSFWIFSCNSVMA
jgi:hypothetical protein